LAREIVKAFGPSESVHLLAHSMGGLDARFLVSNNLGGISERVKTVVGIGTPHLGSPVASVLEAGNPLDVLPGLLHVNGAFLEELRTKADAVRDLSEAGSAALNRRCVDDPRVRYLEIAGVGRDGLFHTSAFLRPRFFSCTRLRGATMASSP
jgi:triacylglycerol lipase